MLTLLPPAQARKRIRTNVPRVRERVPEALLGAINECIVGAKPWPLYVWGDAGVGKTCAALLLCDRLRRPEYWSLQGLCDATMLAKTTGVQMQNGSDVVHMDWSRFWINSARAELLVVDDIGCRVPTDHQFETLMNALEDRIGKPLILISNLALRGIATTFDDRIASRCAAGTVCHVVGEDQRARR